MVHALENENPETIGVNSTHVYDFYWENAFLKRIWIIELPLTCLLIYNTYFTMIEQKFYWIYILQSLFHVFLIMSSLNYDNSFGLLNSLTPHKNILLSSLLSLFFDILTIILLPKLLNATVIVTMLIIMSVDSIVGGLSLAMQSTKARNNTLHSTEHLI